MYRQYENPFKLEFQLAVARKELAENPDDIELALEVHELEEQLNFAWQDDEYESEES